MLGAKGATASFLRRAGSGAKGHYTIDRKGV